MAEALIAFGSNIDPARNVPAAIAALREAVTVTGVSRAWETPPEGTSGPRFVNGVVRVETGADAAGLRRTLRAIEAGLGRRRSGDRNAPRPMDLDLVYLGEEMIEDPADRAFVLVPLAELAPGRIHGPTGKTLEALADRADRAGFRPRPDLDKVLTKT